MINFLGYKFDFFKDIIKNIKNNNLSSININDKYKWKFSFNKDIWEFYIVLRNINKHYILITSLLVFIFILFSRIIGYEEINLNIYSSLIILLLSIFIWYKDILSGEVYLWEKRLRFIDYILFMSIILFFIFLKLSWNLETYERLFIASLFSTVFFIFSINFLWVREVKYWEYKASSYLITILVISIFYFLYWFLNLKYIYHDFYEWRVKVITKTEWEKVFITPSDEEYRIIKQNDLFILKNYKWQDYNFDSLENAQNYILWIYKEDIYLDDKLNEIENTQTLTGSMTDKELIPYILKDENLDGYFNNEIILTNISSDIENYKFYNIAYNLWLISLNSDLTDPVYCYNYVAMKGLLEKWDISEYKNLPFFDSYYNKGIELWEVPNNCLEDKNQLFMWEFIINK